MPIIMKKKLLYITTSVAALLLFNSCQNEEYVQPTADRAGITSLDAYFTSGVNKDKLVVDWKIDKTADITDYVIPVPYYYPEESDNTNEEYMSAMKVVATLENNCTIYPPITVLDLNKKNEFTYTDPYGTQKKITISGQLTRSDKCALKAFTANPGELSGIIDEDNKTISLLTAADLSEMTAEVTLSPHATISPDPTETHNFNNEFKFTVTADNGTSTAEYTVLKHVPEKIANGYRKGSELTLFEKDMTELGVTNANNVHPTLASIGKYVIMNLGDGSAPQYFKKATGSLVGNINMGQANATGAITSDCAGNMLICNYAADGSVLKIFKTNDVTKAPEQFITYNNSLGVNIGSRLHVQGDLKGTATIIATCENSNSYIYWTVNNGTPSEAHVVGMNNISLFWEGYDNVSKVVSRSADATGGVFVDFYKEGKCPLYYAANGIDATQLLSANSTGAGWGYNTAPIDTRDFNNSKYLAIFEMGYWPDWGFPGHIYLFDASSTGAMTGTIDTSSSLKYLYTMPDNYAAIGYAAGGRFGDVLLTPSEDGYFMYIFYASNTHLTFGGIQLDCIDK